MNIEIARKPKSTVEITVTIEPAEMSRYLDDAAQRVAVQVNIPGFRKGKVPRKVLETRVGKEYLEHEALELAITDSYYQAVRQHNLKPVGRPDTKLPNDHHNFEQAGLTYTATVPVLPEVDLGDYKNVKVQPVRPEFKESQVEEVLDQLRSSRASEAQVDRPAAKGDKVEIDFVGTLKGKEFEGGKSENHPLTIGDGNFIPGFEEELVGLGKGAVKKFKIKFPKDYHEQSLAGEKVEFTVTMKQVQETKLPELDDAFAGNFGAKDLAALRKRLAENLKAEKEQQAARQTQAAVMDKVIAQATAEVPPQLVDDELVRMMGEMRFQIEGQGLPYDKYLEHLKKTEDEIKAEARPEAEKRVKTSLVLNGIQEAEHVTATDAEVEAELNQQRALVQEKEDMDRLETEEFKDYVRRIIGNRKVINQLVEWATR